MPSRKAALSLFAFTAMLTCACTADVEDNTTANVITALSPNAAPGVNPEPEQWSHYGGALDGARFADSRILTAENVGDLRRAWTFRTGDVANGEKYFGRRSSFKATPILFDNKLIFSTGFNRVFAIDPVSGNELWRFDPEVDFSISYSEMFSSRGVAAWRNPDSPVGKPCAGRVFVGTLDARLIAIDAANGRRCNGFGRNGEIDLSEGIGNFRRGDYSMTSPPTVVNGVVVAGSSIGDNGGVKLDEGVVRGFDARTGKMIWRFDPIPRNARAPGWETWENDSGRRTGAANVWTIMSADPARDLIYLPTTSPSPDFYGGKRLGDNLYANSVVALRVSTGEMVWAYQLVRHDLWDYDLAAQPLLIDVTVDDEIVPMLMQATKMGFIFTLNRETGEPVHPVEERAVPASDVPGERAAATQKFPQLMLHPVSREAPQLWAYSAQHVETCQRMMTGVRYDGIFTPPSLEGTMLYPGNPGGTNWGSMAAHKHRGVAFVVINRLPTIVKLLPRKDFRKLARQGMTNGVEAQYTEQSGTPYGMTRFELYNRDNGLPCLRGPWATLVAIDIGRGEVIWERPLGYLPGSLEHPESTNWGGFGYGGPLATSGGVVFVASRLDAHLRAFDMTDGKELWTDALPAEPQATPMSYELGAEQYVVIAVGGARTDGKGQGDYLIAYKVKK